MNELNSNSAESADDILTVLVFKDDRAARTFRISLSWISRFGMLLGVLGGLAFLCGLLAFKFYYLAEKSDPARVRDLETQLQSLQTQILQMKSVPLVTVKIPPANPAAGPAPSPVSAPVLSIAPLPIPTVTVTVTPSPLAITSASGSAPASSALLFSALPLGTKIGEASAVPIKIENLKMSWQGLKLQVHFALQYVSSDGGTQNGRIVILVRGSETLLAYPESVLNDMSHASLINPENGEYFSVSRFRETNAEFPAVTAKSQLQSIEILIFGSGNQILLDQKEVIPAKIPSAPKKSVKAKPAPEAEPDDAQENSPDKTADKINNTSNESNAESTPSAITHSSGDAESEATPSPLPPNPSQGAPHE